MNNLNISVRSLLIPMVQEQFLLPNASLAEIVPYSEPTPMPDSPAWMLGSLSWRGLEVPLVSFELLQGVSAAAIDRKSRIAIFNALGGNPQLPFFAVVARGIPHLVMANQSIVTALAEDKPEQQGVVANVLIEAQPAVIPDLDWIESKLLSEGRLFS